MRPDAATVPMDGVTAHERLVVDVPVLRPPRDAQPRPVAWSGNDGVSVARIAVWHWRNFLGPLGLSRLPDRDVRELQEVVVIAVDEHAGLDVVEAASFGRQ